MSELVHVAKWWDDFFIGVKSESSLEIAGSQGKPCRWSVFINSLRVEKDKIWNRGVSPRYIRERYQIKKF